MATITIRNLDEKVKRRLQVRAAINGRSMEAEVREVLSGSVQLGKADRDSEDLGTRIEKRLAALGGVEFEIPPQDHAAEDLKEGLGTAIHKLFAPLGGVVLDLPSRKSHCQIPTLDE
jgi:plasmid stability protein